jgi:predicted DNA-binding transcriptional regulator AlpA
MSTDPLMTPAAAAAYLKVSTKTLARMRQSSDGPPYVHIGPHTYRYRPAELDKWIASRERESA